MSESKSEMETRLDERAGQIKKLKSRLTVAEDRIKKMSKGDLGPESRLAGYSVLVKSLEKRRDELRDQLAASERTIETLKAEVVIQQSEAEIAKQKRTQFQNTSLEHIGNAQQREVQSSLKLTTANENITKLLATIKTWKSWDKTKSQELTAAEEKLTDTDATIKHLRAKAEFDMPVDMQGRFHNACTEPCDMIDGPCACGAWHSAKEWLGKLNKKLAKAELL